MSVAAASIGQVIHPWRALRDLAHVTLEFVDLGPGLLGFTDHDTNTIYLTKGMRQRQRRSVLVHEMTHLERGRVYVGHAVREERAVDAATARALIDLDDLLAAMRWTRDRHELAEELNVSVDVVRDRLAYLHPAERHFLRRELPDPGE